MEGNAKKAHWERIYNTRAINEFSWYQPVPVTSLEFIKGLNLNKSARILDVGGGDSLLPDHLLDLGYSDITVLDISEAALDRAKERLGPRAQQIKWIVSDASTFIPQRQYDLWHDRAAFHFLTEEGQMRHYVEALRTGVAADGKVVIGTFSEDGPARCSGIVVKQYSENSLSEVITPWFEKIRCASVNHETPSASIQNFIFCSFRKLPEAA